MIKILRVLAALLAFTAPLYAQGVGQLGSGLVWGNSTGARAPAAPASITAMLDRALSSTQGAMLYRNATVWTALTPGTAGLPLVSGGAGANLAYAILGLSGGGSNANLTASNGGLVYSTATAMAILAGTATAGQIPRSGSSAAPAWSTATYPATAAAGTMLAAGTLNTIAGTATPTLGVAGSLLGTLALAGNTSGSVLITPQATAGSPTLTLPNASGTFAVSASAPLALSATTGALSVTGAAGQVLAGATPAFTATPTLGANGGTGGQITLSGSTSGSGIVRVAAAAGAGIVFQLPASNGSNTNVLTTDGAGVLSWAAAGSGTVTSVAAGTGMSFTTITTTGSVTVDVASSANFYAGTASKMLDAAGVYGSETTTTYGTTTTFDFATFNYTKVTLTGNITTMTCSNVAVGKAGVIRFIQDGTGSRTTVWCSAFKWASGSAPTLSTAASSTDSVSYYCSTTSFCTASIIKGAAWLLRRDLGAPANDNRPVFINAAA